MKMKPEKNWEKKRKREREHLLEKTEDELREMVADRLEKQVSMDSKCMHKTEEKYKEWKSTVNKKEEWQDKKENYDKDELIIGLHESRGEVYFEYLKWD